MALGTRVLDCPRAERPPKAKEFDDCLRQHTAQMGTTATNWKMQGGQPGAKTAAAEDALTESVLYVRDGRKTRSLELPASLAMRQLLRAGAVRAWRDTHHECTEAQQTCTHLHDDMPPPPHDHEKHLTLARRQAEDRFVLWSPRLGVTTRKPFRQPARYAVAARSTEVAAFGAEIAKSNTQSHEVSATVEALDIRRMAMGPWLLELNQAQAVLKPKCRPLQQFQDEVVDQGNHQP